MCIKQREFLTVQYHSSKKFQFSEFVSEKWTVKNKIKNPTVPMIFKRNGSVKWKCSIWNRTRLYIRKLCPTILTGTTEIGTGTLELLLVTGTPDYLVGLTAMVDPHGAGPRRAQAGSDLGRIPAAKAETGWVATATPTVTTICTFITQGKVLYT